MAKPYTCCQHLANLKVNHNPQQATGQGQVIVCIGKGVKIGITKIFTNHTVDAGETKVTRPSGTNVSNLGLIVRDSVITPNPS